MFHVYPTIESNLMSIEYYKHEIKNNWRIVIIKNSAIPDAFDESEGFCR